MSDDDLEYRPKGKPEDNIAKGLHRIADALESCSRELRDLGNAGAVSPSGTQIGALENLAMIFEKGLEAIALSIDSAIPTLTPIPVEVTTKNDA